jgi:hypothetical protein
MDEPSRVATKVKKMCDACGVGKGVKRKLFLHDDLCEKSVDWAKFKKKKRSVFHSGLRAKLVKEDLDPLITIYEECKADDDDVI